MQMRLNVRLLHQIISINSPKMNGNASWLNILPGMAVKFQTARAMAMVAGTAMHHVTRDVAYARAKGWRKCCKRSLCVNEKAMAETKKTTNMNDASMADARSACQCHCRDLLQNHQGRADLARHMGNAATD